MRNRIRRRFYEALVALNGRLEKARVRAHLLLARDTPLGHPPMLTFPYEGLTVHADIESFRRVAVEVNREIVPRGRHTHHRLQDDDRVEVVVAIGGG